MTPASQTDEDFFERKIFFKWITSAIWMDEESFRMDSSSRSTDYKFFWTDDPICSNGIPSITNGWQIDGKQQVNSF